jgi:hypothetical protein
MPKNKNSRRLTVAALMLTFTIFSVLAFCQSPDSSLSGIVQDPQKKIVVGAIVTIKNKGTDIGTTRSTDDSGRYSFLGLQPGQYTLTIEAVDLGIKNSKDVKISTSSQEVLNVRLQIEITPIVVPVSGKKKIEDEILVEGPGIIQDIAPEYVENLPYLSGNVIDIVSMIGGVVSAPGSKASLDQGNMMIMGTPASGVQLFKDGANIKEPRWNNGIQPPSYINRDSIEQFTFIMSSANAELPGGG